MENNFDLVARARVMTLAGVLRDYVAEFADGDRRPQGESLPIGLVAEMYAALAAVTSRGD